MEKSDGKTRGFCHILMNKNDNYGKTNGRPHKKKIGREKWDKVQNDEKWMLMSRQQQRQQGKTWNKWTINTNISRLLFSSRSLRLIVIIII